jgi:hypothetical protein
MVLLREAGKTADVMALSLMALSVMTLMVASAGDQPN